MIFPYELPPALSLALAWSAVRALLLATLAVTLSAPIDRWLASRGTPTLRTVWLAAALLPLFVPDLLTGFVYRLTAARLVHSIPATEGLYAALLLCRVFSVQVAVRLILPESAVSRSALHAWSLVRRSTVSWWGTWSRLQLMGPWRTSLVAWLAGMLLCFQDFETAALLQVDRHPVTWTVWLFDAQALGEPWLRSLEFVLVPVTLQLLMMVPCLLLLCTGRRLSPPLLRRRRPPGNLAGWMSVALIVGGLSLVVVWPVLQNCGIVFSGIRQLGNDRSVARYVPQILVSVAESATAASLSVLACVWLQRRSLIWKSAAVLPGLCGPLTIALVLLAVFQVPPLHWLYDTWLPMVLGHMLWMLPRAFLFVALLNVMASDTTVHSARLLQAGTQTTVLRSAQDILWTLTQRRWLVAVAVLTHWCLWDVAIASILRPVGFEPIVTRLYNEMHYVGQSETLVTLTLLALLIPLTVWILLAAILKYAIRSRGRL